jgi:Spx/MgsR family transcriptional regulator
MKKSSLTVYGLPNCDSTQKALKWLEQNNIAANLHNYKTDGITEKALQEWSKKAGWQILLNKKSTTWRSLDKQVQDAVQDEASAISVMLQHNSLIKRPITTIGKHLLAGFDAGKWAAVLQD